MTNLYVAMLDHMGASHPYAESKPLRIATIELDPPGRSAPSAGGEGVVGSASAFMLLKLGTSLAERTLAPHVFETLPEAQAFIATERPSAILD